VRLHPNAVDRTGNRYGRLTVIALSAGTYHGALIWLCRCDCGKEVVKTSQYLTKRLPGRNAASCGCANRALAAKKCPICGADFYPNPRRSRGLEQKTCSKKCSFVHRDITGEKNPNWRDNSTLINLSERFTNGYRKWRRQVLERDGYKCVMCGSDKNLHVDHIKRFSDYPALRREVSNGRALCAPCHRKTPTWGNKKSERIAWA
jgi:5-methylcytosine-specific restriction endonuclease McrA